MGLGPSQVFRSRGIARGKAVTWKDRPIEKRLDGTFVIITDKGLPYQVCLRSVDPNDAFDIAEVASAWDALPDGDQRKGIERATQAAPEDVVTARRGEILTRLDEIDQERIRPLSAIILGSESSFDREKLFALESEVVSLRAELSSLYKEFP